MSFLITSIGGKIINQTLKNKIYVEIKILKYIKKYHNHPKDPLANIRYIAPGCNTRPIMSSSKRGPSAAIHCLTKKGVDTCGVKGGVGGVAGTLCSMKDRGADVHRFSGPTPFLSDDRYACIINISYV